MLRTGASSLRSRLTLRDDVLPLQSDMDLPMFKSEEKPLEIWSRISNFLEDHDQRILMALAKTGKHVGKGLGVLMDGGGCLYVCPTWRENQDGLKFLMDRISLNPPTKIILTDVCVAADLLQSVVILLLNCSAGVLSSGRLLPNVRHLTIVDNTYPITVLQRVMPKLLNPYELHVGCYQLGGDNRYSLTKEAWSNTEDVPQRPRARPSVTASTGYHPQKRTPLVHHLRLETPVRGGSHRPRTVTQPDNADNSIHDARGSKSIGTNSTQRP